MVDTYRISNNTHPSRAFVLADQRTRSKWCHSMIPPRPNPHSISSTPLQRAV